MPKIAFIADHPQDSNNQLKNYPDAENYRICPSDYATCSYKEVEQSVEFGCIKECPKECAAIGCLNDDKHCGKDCVDCEEKGDKQNAVMACTTYGACTVKKCKSGYHLKKGEKEDQYACEENTDKSCGAVDSVETSDCSEHAAEYRCHENGYCTVTKCEAGYHLKKGETEDQYACEENTNNLCGAVDSVETSDCSEHAAEYRCHENGYCTVTKCQSGYHLKKGEKEDQYACEKNTDKSCAPVDSVETSDCFVFDENDELYRCHDNGYCTVTKCKVGYHLKKGEKEDQYACEENTAELCGAVDSYVTYSCNDLKNPVLYSPGECNQDGLCECISGNGCDCFQDNKPFQSNCSCHPIAGKDRKPYCVPEVWCGTGSTTIACHNQTGWLTGSCEDLQGCKAETCQVGYKLNDDKCVST